MLRAAGRGFRGLAELAFPLVFPDECRVCGEVLRGISRVPVCSRCLGDPQPLSAEFFCIACRTPFLNRFPLDENGRCPLCRLGLTGFDAVYSYGSYEGSLRKLIHLFKYDKIYTLARPLAGFLARVLPREERFDAIQILAGRKLRDPEAERLRRGRGRTVEHRVGAGHRDPAGAGGGAHSCSGVDEAGVAERFSALEPARQGEVGERKQVAHGVIRSSRPSGSVSERTAAVRGSS